MIAAAHVIFVNRSGEMCLQWLSVELAKMGVDCTPTEWRGYSTVIPQLLVKTYPVALTIQVEDDPEYVPEEIAEMAEDARRLIDDHAYSTLMSCKTRLSIMSTTPPRREETDRQVVVWAQTDLDPETPDVERVLLALSTITDGFLVDCVNGRLRAPGGDAWVPF